jgi:predicted Zn-dependent protease with MMP-like domain
MDASPTSQPDRDHWPRLQTLAQTEVRATVTALPKKLRAAARAVPVIFEPRPDAAALADGTEPDTLGLFLGGERAESDAGYEPLPPHIVLYLENLWEFADGDEEIFCEEVHLTLMHELGHYLGLDEMDLEERGLE